MMNRVTRSSGRITMWGARMVLFNSSHLNKSFKYARLFTHSSIQSNTMAPVSVAILSGDQATSTSTKQNLSSLRPTSVIHRTPWRPPVAKSAEGIYIELEDGRRVIDAVGGAAVACLGTSHPVVRQAIRDQLDRVPCTCRFVQLKPALTRY